MKIRREEQEGETAPAAIVFVSEGSGRILYLVLLLLVLASLASADVDTVGGVFSGTVADSTGYPYVYLLNGKDCDVKLIEVSGTQVEDFLVDLAVVGLLSYSDFKDDARLDLQELSSLRQIYTPRTADETHDRRLKLFIAATDTIDAFSVTAVSFDFFDELALVHRVVASGSFTKSGSRTLRSRPGPASRKRSVADNHRVKFPLYYRDSEVMQVFLYVDRIRYRSGEIWRADADENEKKMRTMLSGWEQ